MAGSHCRPSEMQPLITKPRGTSVPIVAAFQAHKSPFNGYSERYFAVINTSTISRGRCTLLYTNPGDKGMGVS